MLVAGSWRGVDDQEVKRTPGHVADELADGAGDLGTTPDDGLILVLQERVHGHNADFAGVHGREKLLLLVDFNGCLLNTEQIGHARAVNVHIKDANLVAKLGHGAGNIDSDGALADAAFAAHDENLVLDVGKSSGDFLVLLGDELARAGSGPLGMTGAGGAAS